MKRGGHVIRQLSHRGLRPGFEKTTHNLCPSCGNADLTVYFKSASRVRVGAYCYSCGLVGFFARNEFFELGRMTSRLVPYRKVSELASG